MKRYKTIIQHYKIPNNTNCITLSVTQYIKTHTSIHPVIILTIILIHVILTITTITFYGTCICPMRSTICLNRLSCTDVKIYNDANDPSGFLTRAVA